MVENSDPLVEKLSALLREPIQRPEDAKRAARAARALENLLRAAEEAEAVLAGGPRPASEEGGSLAGRSLHDAAEIVLEEAGEPLHGKELGRRIYDRGWTHPRGTPSRLDQIVNQLAARLRKHPHRFQLVAPNTFGLVKWGETNGRPRASRPRLGLFSGPSRATGRQIGEQPNAPAGSSEWRSS